MFYLSINSGLNIGIPTTIISVTPLYVALLDKIFYKSPLQLINLLGFILLIISSSFISLSKVLDSVVFNLNDIEENKVYLYKPYLSVIMATFISLTIAADVMLQKYCVKILEMDPLEQSFLRFIVVGIFYTIFCTFYWIFVESFIPYYFVMGIFSGIFLGISKVLQTYSLNAGPAGGCTAITGITNSVLFTFLECLRYLKMVRVFDIIGAIVSIFGCLLVSVPEKFQQCFKKKPIRVHKDLYQIDS